MNIELLSLSTLEAEFRNCTFYTFLFQLANQSAYRAYSAYRSKEYREATTKEELCKAPIDRWEVGKAGNMEKMKKEYNEYCLKSKSNNIIFCPEEIIKRNNDKKVKWINDYFKNYFKTQEERSILPTKMHKIKTNWFSNFMQSIITMAGTM